MSSRRPSQGFSDAPRNTHAPAASKPKDTKLQRRDFVPEPSAGPSKLRKEPMPNPEPEPKSRPKKKKPSGLRWWEIADKSSPVLGLARRPGEKKSTKYGLEFDSKHLGHKALENSASLPPVRKGDELREWNDRVHGGLRRREEERKEREKAEKAAKKEGKGILGFLKLK